MRMPAGLKNLDDRVIGRKRRGRPDDPDGGHDDADGAAHGDHDESGERTTTRTVETRPARKGNGDGVQTFLATVWRISRLVLLALALVLVLAIAFVLLPTNEDNVIVRNVLDLGEQVAGPFKDVFTVDDPERMRIYNYGLAAAVYAVLGSIVAKLPTGSKRAG